MTQIQLSKRHTIKEAQVPFASPRRAAESIYRVIQFMFHRVPIKHRRRFMHRLIGKLVRISPAQIGSKKLPSSAAIGQAIGITKNLLMGLEPGFIGLVLQELSRILGAT